MELREALTQISEIRQQLARTEVFRGYRAVPVAFSGLLAFAVAAMQASLLPEPSANLSTYLALWVGAALVSLLATGLEMHWHPTGSSAVQREKSHEALGQFVPCLAAGGLLTVCLARCAPESSWMLPGLWSMLFGLGIFASWPFLPRAVGWIGAYYLTAGLCCLAWAQGEAALSPWAMALPFGVGQLLTSSVLYWTLERGDEEK